MWVRTHAWREGLRPAPPSPGPSLVGVGGVTLCCLSATGAETGGSAWFRRHAQEGCHPCDLSESVGDLRPFWG